MDWPFLLERLAPNALEDVKAAFIKADSAFSRFGLNTPLRQAHFIAQALHESGGFTRLEENLNYSAERLVKVFPKYFPDIEFAKQYARNPEKIANRVYQRVNMGNVSPGDGWRYRGRGIFQLTGANNYALVGKHLEINLVLQPELACSPEHLLPVACAFWVSRNLSQYADRDDLDEVTRRINGGFNGIEDRASWLARTKRELGVA